jgi:hypothetical protein
LVLTVTFGGNNRRRRKLPNEKLHKITFFWDAAEYIFKREEYLSSSEIVAAGFSKTVDKLY